MRGRKYRFYLHTEFGALFGGFSIIVVELIDVHPRVVLLLFISNKAFIRGWWSIRQCPITRTRSMSNAARVGTCIRTVCGWQPTTDYIYLPVPCRTLWPSHLTACGWNSCQNIFIDENIFQPFKLLVTHTKILIPELTIYRATRVN